MTELVDTIILRDPLGLIRSEIDWRADDVAVEHGEIYGYKPIYTRLVEIRTLPDGIRYEFNVYGKIITRQDPR